MNPSLLPSVIGTWHVSQVNQVQGCVKLMMLAGHSDSKQRCLSFTEDNTP